jgi:hypothetical protein
VTSQRSQAKRKLKQTKKNQTDSDIPEGNSGNAPNIPANSHTPLTATATAARPRQAKMKLSRRPKLPKREQSDDVATSRRS